MKKQNILNKNNLPKWNLKPFNLEITNIEQIKEKFSLELPYGFIYVIGYNDNTFYIGKKVFYKYVDLPITFNTKVRENVIGEPFNKRKNHKLVLHETVRKESNWLNYTGSNELIEPKIITHRNMLQIAVSKLHLTFLENKYLFNNILKPNCINLTIDNKIFKDKVLDDLKKVYLDSYDLYI